MSTAPQEPGATDPLYAGVAELTRKLHEALHELGLDRRLSQLAGANIPGVYARLEHVVRLGESAAHRTLDLVEEGRRVADGLYAVRQGLHGATIDGAAADAGLAGLQTQETRLRNLLTGLAQAQEYQDLTGQVIGRIVRLVRDVENGLVELLSASGLQAGTALPITAGEAAGGAEHGAPADQAGADRLLASLGF